MRRYLSIYMALLAIFVVSCIKGDGYIGRNDAEMVAQTTLMYFMGTSLKSNYFDVYNIPDTQVAVAAGALGDNGRLLIFMPSNSSRVETMLYEIYRTTDGYATEVVETYDSNESLTQERICQVIARSQEFAPALTYNLILSGHGTGWVEQSYPYLKSVESEDIWAKREEGDFDVMTRFLGSSSDGYMEVSELSAALELTQTKFGYILFDMCFMSNIETLYELKDVCDNVIASPCEVMGFGFPYQTVLPELFADSGKSYDLQGVGEAYYEFYKEHPSYPSGSVAVCQTEYLEGLATVVKRINAIGVNSVDINDLQCYENLATNVFCDLGHFVEEACTDESLYEDFEQVMNFAFPYKYTTGLFYTMLSYSSDVWESGSKYWVTIDEEHFSGVSTSQPSTKFTSEWVETSWAVATSAQ